MTQGRRQKRGFWALSNTVPLHKAEAQSQTQASDSHIKPMRCVLYIASM